MFLKGVEWTELACRDVVPNLRSLFKREGIHVFVSQATPLSSWSLLLAQGRRRGNSDRQEEYPQGSSYSFPVSTSSRPLTLARRCTQKRKREFSILTVITECRVVSVSKKYARHSRRSTEERRGENRGWNVGGDELHMTDLIGRQSVV